MIDFEEVFEKIAVSTARFSERSLSEDFGLSAKDARQIISWSQERGLIEPYFSVVCPTCGEYGTSGKLSGSYVGCHEQCEECGKDFAVSENDLYLYYKVVTEKKKAA